MELKEYLKEMITKIDNKEEEGGMCSIYITEDIKFNYHDECFADFQDDFCILYDKVTETSMVIPYDKIATMQYMTEDIVMKQAKEMGLEKIFKKLMED